MTFGINLEPLPLATVEAADVARLYPKSKLIADADVASNPSRAAAAHSLLHFAGHSLVNPMRFSCRVSLYHPIDQTARYTLMKSSAWTCAVEMVVLSACDTADGRSRSEGVISVARAFMKAGVPTVIATLWSVEDSAGRTMFARFHSGFLDTSDPARVLTSYSARSFAEKLTIGEGSVVMGRACRGDTASRMSPTIDAFET